MSANSQVLLVGAGAVAIVLALLWRFAVRHHVVARLEHQLGGHPDPAERARAGHELIDLGLRRAAVPVLRVMAREPDDRVRLSVALAVARRQWEPTGADRVARLRRWAADELDYQQQPVSGFGPALTRLADMGGPRLTNGGAPGPDGATVPAAPAPPPAPPAPPSPAAPDADDPDDDFEEAIRVRVNDRPYSTGRGGAPDDSRVGAPGDPRTRP